MSGGFDIGCDMPFTAFGYDPANGRGDHGAIIWVTFVDGAVIVIGEKVVMEEDANEGMDRG